MKGAKCRQPGMSQVAKSARRRLRKRGLSQAKAARRMRYSLSALSRLLNGHTASVTRRMARALARVLGGEVAEWEARADGKLAVIRWRVIVGAKAVCEKLAQSWRLSSKGFAWHVLASIIGGIIANYFPLPVAARVEA